MKGYATLYPANATEEMLSSNGLGVLSDCISGTVTRERNGEYEIEFEYPIDGAHFSDIALGFLVKAEPEKDHSEQLFEIYAISKPKNGKCTINGEHVSYRLNRVTVEPYEATGASSALAGLVTHSIGENPFTTWTDIENTTTQYTQTEPATFRGQLGGVEGSILDLFGGEYDFDNYVVKLYKAMGTDRGVTVEYGKNLIDLEQEESIQDTITGIVPYWIDNEGQNLVMLSEKVIECANAGNFPYKRTIPYDFSQEFQDKPTEEQLRSAAQAYVKANITGTPDVSITVSAQNLADTEEYKNLSQEIIRLCDTVTVKFIKLGVNATAKVVSIEYDFINRKINEFTLGSIRSNLATEISKGQEETQASIDKSASFLQKALDDAKKMLMGGYGGHVVPSYNADKQMNAIYVIDTTDIATATKGILINVNGIGGFQDGINGKVSAAMTIDGKIVADAITTGTLKGIRIEGNTIVGGTIEGTTIKFGTAYPVTMSANSDGDGVLISGTGEINMESTGNFSLDNNFSDGTLMNRIYMNSATRGSGVKYGTAAIETYEIGTTTPAARVAVSSSQNTIPYASLEIPKTGSTALGAFVQVSKSDDVYTVSAGNTSNFVTINDKGDSAISLTAYVGKISLTAFEDIEISARQKSVLITQGHGGYEYTGGTVQGKTKDHQYMMNWDGANIELYVDGQRVKII